MANKFDEYAKAVSGYVSQGDILGGSLQLASSLGNEDQAGTTLASLGMMYAVGDLIVKNSKAWGVAGGVLAGAELAKTSLEVYKNYEITGTIDTADKIRLAGAVSGLATSLSLTAAIKIRTPALLIVTGILSLVTVGLSFAELVVEVDSADALAQDKLNLVSSMQQQAIQSHLDNVTQASGSAEVNIKQFVDDYWDNELVNPQKTKEQVYSEVESDLGVIKNQLDGDLLVENSNDGITSTVEEITNSSSLTKITQTFSFFEVSKTEELTNEVKFSIDAGIYDRGVDLGQQLKDHVTNIYDHYVASHPGMASELDNVRSIYERIRVSYYEDNERKIWRDVLSQDVSGDLSQDLQNIKNYIDNWYAGKLAEYTQIFTAAFDDVVSQTSTIDNIHLTGLTNALDYYQYSKNDGFDRVLVTSEYGQSNIHLSGIDRNDVHIIGKAPGHFDFFVKETKEVLSIFVRDGAGAEPAIMPVVTFGDSAIWDSQTDTGTYLDDYVNTYNSDLSSINTYGGNDVIYLSNPASITSPGEGNDRVFVSKGSHEILFSGGFGKDYMGLGRGFVDGTETPGLYSGHAVVRFLDRQVSDFDKIYFNGEGNLIFKSGENLLRIDMQEHIAVNDKQSFSKLDSVIFSDGTVWSDEQLSGLAVRDGINPDIYDYRPSSIVGSGGNDIIELGKKTDYVNALDGDDSITFNMNDGMAPIVDIDAGDGDDTVLLTGSSSGIDAVSINLGAGNDTLDLGVTANEPTTILLKDGFGKDRVKINNDIVTLHFDYAISPNQVFLEQINNNEVLVGTSISNDTVIIEDYTQPNFFPPFFNLKFQNGEFFSNYEFISYINSQSPTNGDDIFQIFEPNITRSGGAGDDTYHIYKNTALVTIDDVSGANDKVNINWSEGLSSVQFYSYVNDDLVIKSQSGSVVIQNYFSGGDTIEEIKFGSTVLDGAFIQNNLSSSEAADKLTVNPQEGVLYGYSGNDLLTGSLIGDFISGGNDNDIIYGLEENDYLLGELGDDEVNGGSGDDLLFGGVGDDVLDGGLDNDTLFGGEGDDTLIGGGGNDTYIFSAGFGSDIIDTTGRIAGDVVRIQFASDVNESEVVASRDIDDLILSVNTDSIRILSFFTLVESIDQVVFEGGSVWSHSQLVAMASGMNAPPVAANDSISTHEDTAVVIDVGTLLANDSDMDGESLTITSVGNSVNGVAVLDGNAGTITFTPAGNYQGPASFDYTVSDGIDTATATVDVSVGVVMNYAPVAANDTVSTAEDTPVVIDVATLLANDTDADGDSLMITSVGNSVNGIAVLDGNAGTITFTPTGNYQGPASFDYTVSDGIDTATATVDVSVGVVMNYAPVATSDTASVSEDAPVVIDVATLLANDSDADGDNLTITSVSNSVNGSAVLDGNAGTITFTPAVNYNGSASFDYTVSDGVDTATTTVDVMVGSINDTPVATNDNASTSEDTAVVINVAALLANDSDVDGDSLTVTSVSNSVNGTAVLDSVVGTITFTPTANYNGPASFDYTVSDGTGTATATVDVMVGAVNDTPVATNDTASTAEDTAVVIDVATLLANDTDADGDSLSITAVNNSVNGTAVLDSVAGTITFTPTADYSGPAGFDYTVSDGTDTATATVDVTVGAVNDTPVAANDTASTVEDTAVVINVATLLANDSDVEGDTLSITAVNNGVNGTAVLDSVAGTITFMPAADYNGPASFDYTVSDGIATSVATVDVTVGAVNDTPIATNDTASTAEDTPVVIDVAALLVNDTDADGDTLNITAVSNGVNGTAALDSVAGTITFTPAADYNGPASFDYTVSDGTDTATATVDVTVGAVNDTPVATNDTALTAEDTAVVVDVATLLANDSDVDGDTLSITAVSNSVNGTAVLDSVAGTITFTPTANYNGPASFDYTVSDGVATSVATVGVTVNAVVNHTPVAADDALGSLEAQTLVIPVSDLLLNDTDVDGDTLTITSITSTSLGTAVLDVAAQTITYTRPLDHLGQVTFDYTVSDGTLTDTATATIDLTTYLQYGTTSNNTLTGTNNNDSLYGLSGHDTLSSGLGDDNLIGGAGDDTLNGEDGDDTFLYSGHNEGLDTVDGGAGFDTLQGSSGDDTIGLWELFANDSIERIDGGAGHNIIETGSGWNTLDFSNTELLNIAEIHTYGGWDTVTGSAQDDTVYAGSGQDTVSGGAGNDYLDGGVEVDTLNGDAGNDTLVGGEGNDTLNGGDGDDTFLYAGQNEGLDTVDGGTGFDTLLGSSGDDTFGLRELLANDSIERIDGGAGHNIIEADFGDAWNTLDFSNTELINIAEIRTHGGWDTITGSAQDDTVYAGSGLDTVSGGAGNDYLDGGVEADTLNGDAGNDTLVGGEGNDTLSGGDGDDTFLYSGQNEGLDTVDGGAGFDTLLGSSGDDTFGLRELLASDSIERIDGGAGHNIIEADFGNAWNTLDFSNTELINIAEIRTHGGWDTITGSAQDDTVYAGSGQDTVSGGAGNDYLDGGVEVDTLNGDAGNDTLVGGEGNDTLNGGDGDDTFLYAGQNEGLDTVDGGAGFDTLLGSSGDDTFGLRELLANDSIERIDGGAGHNIIEADFGNAWNTLDFSNTELINIAEIRTHGGWDTITGSAQDDVIDAGDHNDTVSGGLGHDQLIGGGGADTLNGDAGNDTLNGGAENDTLSGGDGDDTFLYSGQNEGLDTVDGGAGFDTLLGSSGDDTFGLRELLANDSIERIDGGAGHNIIEADFGNAWNTLDFSNTELINIAEIRTHGGWDTITGSAQDDTVYAGSGLDTISGGAGNDYLDGGVDADTLNGDAGNDTLVGGEGNDTLSGGHGNDTLNGGQGNDRYTMVLGDGQDVIDNNASDHATALDILEFTDANYQDLWFSQVNNDLVIDHVGTDTEVTVQGWFADTANTVDKIEAIGGALHEAEVQQLVTAMAGLRPSEPDGIDSAVLNTSEQTTLNTALAAAWS